MKQIRWRLAVTLAVAGAACSGTARPPADHARPEVAALRWRPFGEAAFEEARREGRWVLLDVGIEGCTACRCWSGSACRLS